MVLKRGGKYFRNSAGLFEYVSLSTKLRFEPAKRRVECGGGRCGGSAASREHLAQTEIDAEIKYVSSSLEKQC